MKLVHALVALSLLATPAAALNVAAETPSQNVEVQTCLKRVDFIQQIIDHYAYMDPRPVINEVTGRTLEAYKAQMRANGTDAFDGITSLIWVVAYDQGHSEAPYVGIVFVQGECVLDVTMVTPDEWAAFVKEALKNAPTPGE